LLLNLTPLILPHEIFDFAGTPFIPLSLKGEGEEILERGKAPLLLTLSLLLLREGRQGDRF
jgi:hypothetical protein